MDLHIFFHTEAPPDMVAALSDLTARITSMAATLDDLVQQVQTQTGTVASMTTFIQGLETQIKDALAGVTLSPEAQAKVDGVFSALQQNTQAIADAIDSDPNTPTPPTPPEPAPQQSAQQSSRPSR